MDLLQHEVLVARLLGGGQVPLDLEWFDGHLGPVEVRDANRAGANLRDLVLGQREEPGGSQHDGGDVGGEEVLPVAEPDDERRGHLHAHDHVRLLGGEDDQGVGSGELPHRRPNGLGQIPLVPLLHEVGDDLGVGLGGEPVTGLDQPVLQGLVVLDDPVVDDGDAALAINVGMRVLVGRSSVSRPSRICPAGRSPSARAFSSSESFPARLTTRTFPSRTATPAES